MNKSEVIRLIRQRQAEIQAFDVASLNLFGSTARGQERTNSDVDFLVTFHHPATFDNYMSLKFYLEDLLGCPVDLVTQNSVREAILPNIERDAIQVA